MISHIRVAVPRDERAFVALVGPNVIFYSNNIGTFGAVAARPIGAVFPVRPAGWISRLLGMRKSHRPFSRRMPSFLAMQKIGEGAFINRIFLLILRYRLIEKGFWPKQEIVCVGVSINAIAAECGILLGKRRFDLGGLRLLRMGKNPTPNQAQSDALSLQCASRICIWIRPFSAALYAFSEIRRVSVRAG